MSKNKNGFCPVCGTENTCAIAAAVSEKDSVALIATCWCAKIPHELDSSLLPEHLKNEPLYCLCRQCLEKFKK